MLLLLKVTLKYLFMKTELVTTLKRRATKIISSLERQREPILITQHGRPAAYLLDVTTYERLRAKLAVLEMIGRGEKAIEEGRVVTQREARRRMSRWLK